MEIGKRVKVVGVIHSIHQSLIGSEGIIEDKGFGTKEEHLYKISFDDFPGVWMSKIEIEVVD